MKQKIKKFIYYYSQNSRLKTKELGKLSGFGQQSMSYLIASYQKKQILRETNVVVDPAKFGLITVTVYYNFIDLDQKHVTEVVNYLKNEDSITSIEQLESGFDLLCTYCVPNLSNFNKTNGQFLQNFKKRVFLAGIAPVVVTHLYPKKYLMPRKLPDEIVICGDRDVESLSDVEGQVLLALYQDSSATFLALAKKSKIHPKTVIRIKAKLEKKKIIRGYSPLFDFAKLGIKRRRILLNGEYLSLQEDRKFLEFVKVHPCVVGFTRQLGKHNLVLDVEGENLVGKDVLRDVRSEFQVADFRVLSRGSVLKKKFIPTFL